ncbi:hypothetical protein GQ457_06G010050 [Hibiscus cannabinus]
MNIMNVLHILHEHEEQPPRTASNHHRPPTAGDGTTAPTTASPSSGHRPWWSDPQNLIFFPITRTEAPQHLNKIKNLRSTRMVSLIGDAPQRRKIVVDSSSSLCGDLFF